MTATLSPIDVVDLSELEDFMVSDETDCRMIAAFYEALPK